MSKPVRVLIAEDDVLMREGSRGCFWRQDWRSSVERVTRSFRRKALAHRPDVAVVDIQLPPGRGDDGLRAALELRGRLPNTGVLVLS